MKSGTSLMVCVLIAVLLVVTNTVSAAEEKKAPIGSKELERMKQLSGVWEGTGTMPEGEQKVRVEYRVTSAGSALVETLFPGTPHEMVSVYYDEGSALMMTHYCSLRNRPHMRLTHADEKTIDLVFHKGGDIAEDRDAHMHSLSIAFNDKDRIVQTWTYWENGKAKDRTVLKLTRLR